MRPFGLFVLSCFVLLGWKQLVPQPFDWDSGTYRSVALHLLHGEGAVTGALWNLLVLPEHLPMPADLYWMPLPSRILVPALALSDQGDQWINLLLGATLAPLAWATGRVRAPKQPGIALGAGLLAATGGMYARFLVSADSVALFGVLGGLGFLAVAHQQVWLATGCAILAALTRNDGFLLGLAFGLGISGRRGWLPAVAGIATWGLWQGRNAALVEGWWGTRAALSRVLDLSQLVRGEIPEVGWGERLSFALHRIPPTALMVGLLVLPFPAILRLIGEGWGIARSSPEPARISAGQRHGDRAGWLRSVQAYALGLPLVGYLLAPAIFAEGSFFRSSVALYPVACVLAVEAWAKLQSSRYHPAFLPSLAGLTMAGLQAIIGGHTVLPLTSADCSPLQALPKEAVVFSNHPPLVEATCGRSSVILPIGSSAARLEELANRYGISAALLTGVPGAGGTPDPKIQLPGWEFREGLWWRPTSPPPPSHPPPESEILNSGP